LSKKELIPVTIFGESAWESNPPARVLAPRTGFEVINLKFLKKLSQK